MLNTIEQMALHTNEVAILWLGQNSYILKTPQGTLFAIDPYLTRDSDYQYIHPNPPITASEFKVDYIFCTHDHLDHTDPAALPIISAHFPATTIFGPQESCDHLFKLGVAQSSVRPLYAHTKYILNEIQVTPFYSIPPSDPVTTHFGYLFTIGDTSIYNMGDTNQTVVNNPRSVLDCIAREAPDIAMFPIIGDTPERKPSDASKFARIVQPKIAIPCHYDCFTNRTIDPHEFTRLLQNEPWITTVVIPYCGLYHYKPITV
jgi:L-ascorbate 6-phosphate lactonase